MIDVTHGGGGVHGEVTRLPITARRKVRALAESSGEQDAARRAAPPLAKGA